jgi:hypothetical protein
MKERIFSQLLPVFHIFYFPPGSAKFLLGFLLEDLFIVFKVSRNQFSCFSFSFGPPFEG